MKILSTRAEQAAIKDGAVIYKEARLPEVDSNEITYTISMIEELFRCRDDSQYFIRKYLLPTVMEQQELLLNVIQEHKKVIFEKERCTGVTTVMIARLVWEAMFVPDRTIMFVSPTYSIAMHARNQFNDMMAQVPGWMKPRVIESTKDRIQFDNGARVLFDSASEKTGRGMAISSLYIDEANMIRPEIFERFIQCISPCMRLEYQTFVIGGSWTSGSSPFKSLFNASTVADGHFYPHIVLKENTEYGWDDRASIALKDFGMPRFDI